MSDSETLLSRVASIARATPEHVAVEDDGGRHSFGCVWRRAHRVTAALSARHLVGARLALFATAGAPWLEGFLGALLAGGTIVALSPSYPAPELRSLFEASRARAVLVSSDLEAVAHAALGDAALLPVEALAESDPAGEYHPPAAVPGDLAMILFTSGTTGKPKGARITHGNALCLAETLGRAWGFSPNDVLLHTLPLHHLHGIGVSLLVALVAGATTRFVRFEPQTVWEELGRATVLMGVPTQHKKLFDAFDSADAETQRRWGAHGKALRLVTSGSAALPERLGERWRRLSGVYPLERYGMTEIGIVLSNPLEGERRPGTVGKTLEGVSVRVVGDDGRDVTSGEPGELWVRASTVFAGYDENAQATSDAFSDGWFKTGDTVSRAADGYVRILGRTSLDILKSGGYKLSALEIERVLCEHEDIADASVFALPDEMWGDLVAAAVVEKAGRTITEAGVRDWMKTQVAPYNVPKRIVRVRDLPRNALGKVQKKLLAELLAARGRG